MVEYANNKVLIYSKQYYKIKLKSNRIKKIYFAVGEIIKMK